MSRRERIKSVAKVERRKRVVTYLTVEREIVTLGPVSSAVAVVLRDLRAKSGMTQEATAALIGISRPALANIEAGRQRVLLEDLWDYARAFDVSVHALFKMIATAVANSK